MRVVIARTANVVVIDGRPLQVDCSGLDQRIHVVEWYGERGVIEYLNGPNIEWKANDPIDDFSPYQSFVDAWEAARVIADAPLPPNSMLSDFDFGKTIADMFGTSTGAS